MSGTIFHNFKTRLFGSHYVLYNFNTKKVVIELMKQDAMDGLVSEEREKGSKEQQNYNLRLTFVFGKLLKSFDLTVA